jgi:hypothetical protein
LQEIRSSAEAAQVAEGNYATVDEVQAALHALEATVVCLSNSLLYSTQP